MFCVPFAQLPSDSISSTHVTTQRPAWTRPPSLCRARRSYASSFACSSMKFHLMWICATPATVASGLPLRAPAPGPGVSTLISVAVSMCPFRKRGRTHPRRLARFAQRDLLASPVLHPSVPRSVLMLRGTAAIIQSLPVTGPSRCSISS